MDKIPDELWTLIVGGDIEVYRLLIKACPRFARLTMEDNSYWKGIFVECKYDEWSENWFLAGKRHRGYDLPAVIYSKGAHFYGSYADYVHRMMHVENRWLNDKPADSFDGTQEWWFNNQLHREGDKPARIHKNGNQEWWFNNKRHRENDQPAIVSRNRQEWWFNGERHREGNQPAVIYGDGRLEWWFNGRRIDYNS